MSVSWNPWHGCVKLSPGCKYCYVYRQDKMYGSAIPPQQVRKTAAFDLPVQRGRNGRYKVISGEEVYTCFTSDFLLPEADEWREQAWRMIKTRRDLTFIFFTKRIDRFPVMLPADWGDGYENVVVGCTVENQEMADFRLPIFKSLPIKHKLIICAPLLEPIALASYLDDSIKQVAVSGESGTNARVCDYEWILDIRRQCIEMETSFCFHQTGANFLKNGKYYRVPRRFQIRQAVRANIDIVKNKPSPESKPYTLF